MRTILFLFTSLFLSVFQTVTAQNYHPGNDELLASGLALVTIETEGGIEPTAEMLEAPEGCWGTGTTNKTKVPSRMIIQKGEDVLYDSGEYEKKVSGLLLSIRGNSSAHPLKKPYKIKHQKKEDLLFRGNKAYKDKDWALIKDDQDITLNSLVGFKLGEMAGLRWSPKFQYVNLIVNGDYRGVYMLVETVNESEKRLSVNKDSGYIIEYDSYWWNEDLSLEEGKWYRYAPMRYTFKYPDSEDITQEQIDIIQSRVNAMEQSVEDGTYEQQTDVSSFVAWLMAHDILGTYDSGGSNIYLTLNDDKEDTKFQMGNLWDMDTIERTEGAWSNIHIMWGYYFKWLFESKNSAFLDAYKNKWDELSPVLVDQVETFLDEFAASEEGLGLDVSMQYDAKRWNYIPNTVAVEIAKNKEWFTSRKEWLDENVAKIRSPWNTYVVSFENTGNWEKVFAYAWTTTGEGEDAVTTEFLGAWPGTELAKNEETGFYEVTIKEKTAPRNIIFSNGLEGDAQFQTKDLDFEDGKAYRYQPIEIDEVEIRGSFNGWSKGEKSLMTKVKGVDNIWTMDIDLSTTADNQQFKLVIPDGTETMMNEETGEEEEVEKAIWLGWNSLRVDADDGWVVASEENEGQPVDGCNFKLMNATIGMTTYTLIATWTPGTDKTAGWTLKVAAKNERPVTYTVVGVYDTADGELDVFGTAWDVTLTDNDMVEEDGIWTLTKENVQLKPGMLVYKVVKFHSWDAPSWGVADGNAEYKVDEEGLYTLKFKFNPDEAFENGSNVDCEVAKTGDIPVDEQVYTLVGSFQKWTNGEAVEEVAVDKLFDTMWDIESVANTLTFDEHSGNYTIEFRDIELPSEGYILYKIVKNHSWEGNGWGRDAEANNCYYWINKAGIYTITFTFHPTTPVTDDGWFVKCVALCTDDFTGISTINHLPSTVQCIYNLNGQRVENVRKGLYIVNGRKVVIK